MYPKEIWKKYTDHEKEHAQLLQWMHKLGYNTRIKTERPTIANRLQD